MKKIFTLLLTFSLLFTFAACGSKKDEKPNKDTFTKPEGYVTVMKITINPEFNLYLDDENMVLAIEPLNNDAKKVTEKLSYKKNDLYTVVKDVINASNDAGLVKENAYVKVDITETKDKTIDTNSIITNTQNAIKEKTTELKITVSFEPKGENNIKNESPNPEPSHNDPNPDQNEDNNNNRPDDDTPPAVDTKEIFTYNLFMTDTFNSDGSLNFDVIARNTIQYQNNDPYLKSEIDGIEFHYEIPEKVVYERALALFAVTGELWNDFKADGSYELDGPERASYVDGMFIFDHYDGWGGGEVIMYNILNHTDDKNGNLTITYQATPEDNSPYKIQITYQYSKNYANVKYDVINSEDVYEYGTIKSESKGFIDSLKVSGIKKF